MERLSHPPAACIGDFTEEDAPAAFNRVDGVDLGLVFRMHASYVAAIAIRLLGRDDEVDDVVQDVFVAAARGLSLRDTGAVRGWLATVTVRMATRRLRLRRLRAFVGLDHHEGYADLCAPDASPEQRAMVARMYELLDGLPVAERLAWVLHRVEGEPLPHAAALCGCSLATVKRRIAAAQQRLDAALAGTRRPRTTTKRRSEGDHGDE